MDIRLDKEVISAVMREMGRKGGRIGGKRALRTMTREQRVARARKASAAAVAARKRRRSKG